MRITPALWPGLMRSRTPHSRLKGSNWRRWAPKPLPDIAHPQLRLNYEGAGVCWLFLISDGCIMPFPSFLFACLPSSVIDIDMNNIPLNYVPLIVIAKKICCHNKWTIPEKEVSRTAVILKEKFPQCFTGYCLSCCFFNSIGNASSKHVLSVTQTYIYWL